MEISLDNIIKLWMKLWFDKNALSRGKLYPPEDDLKSANFMLGFWNFSKIQKMN